MELTTQGQPTSAREVQAQWLNLALDMMLSESQGRTLTASEISDAYGITEEQVYQIQSHPLFLQQYETLKSWLETSGQDTPTVIQTLIMSMNLKEKLFTEAMTSEDVSFRDKLAFFSELQKELPQAPQEEGGNSMPVINLNIHSNIRGMGEFTGMSVAPALEGESREVEG